MAQAIARFCLDLLSLPISMTLCLAKSANHGTSLGTLHRVAMVDARLSILAAAHYLGCAKETAYRWIAEFNRRRFRHFDRSSNPAGRPSQLTRRRLALLYPVAPKRPTDEDLSYFHDTCCLARSAERVLRNHTLRDMLVLLADQL
jgi:hypothetical protein